MHKLNDVDIKGSRLAMCVDMVYAAYEENNNLGQLPEGINNLNTSMQEGNYTFSKEDLTNWFPQLVSTLGNVLLSNRRLITKS